VLGDWQRPSLLSGGGINGVKDSVAIADKD
jgi:hypothetical protein